MVDTFVIKIKGKNNFSITKPEFFTPEFKMRTFEDLSDTEKHKVPHSQKFVLHSENKDPSSSKIKVEIYEHPKPETREIYYIMRIEANAPKILYSNNLLELPDNCGPQIEKIMMDKLARDGIHLPIYKNVIRNATISAVHFGKNILLQEYSVREIIDELSKLEISRYEDITKNQYRNGGDTLQFFSGVREYAFYDKIKDIRKTKNKQVDKSSKMSQEKDIVSLYGLENCEFLRFEYRLKKSQTLQSEINKALGENYGRRIVFLDLFSRTVQTNVLKNAWTKLINRKQNQLTLISLGNQNLKIFEQAIRNARKEGIKQHSQNKAFTSCLIAMLFKEIGVRTVRDELNKIWSPKADERLKTKIQNALDLLDKLPISDKIAFITKKLDEFEIIDQQYLMRVGNKLSTRKPWDLV